MRYTDSHEWISVSGKKGRVGITAHAQGELGDIVFVELPKVGQQVKAGEETCVLESTKAAADVYSPVSGTVTGIHDTLKQNTHALNDQPESAGWLFEIELSDPKEADRLMTLDQYKHLLSR